MENKHMRLLLLLFVFILIAIAFYPDHTVNTDSEVTGNQIVDTRVNIVPSPSANCSFQLQEGWNLVSFYCLSLYEPLSDVMASVNTSYGSVFEYVSSNSSDPWKSYNPDLPNWTVQQLSSMGRTQGYWIYMESTADYFFEGSRRDSSIYLQAGWNLVGYPSVTDRQINTSLSGLTYTIVKGYDESTDSYTVHIFNASNNTLVLFETYGGYWINSSSTQTWSVTGS
jgi:hypothetical protein